MPATTAPTGPNATFVSAFSQPAIYCVDTPEEPVTDPCFGNSLGAQAAAAFCSALVDSSGPYADCLPHVDTRSLYSQCVSAVCSSADPRAAACPSYRVLEFVCEKAEVLSFRSVINDCGDCFSLDSCVPDDEATCTVYGHVL